MSKEIICPTCGNSLDSSTEFCLFCGTLLKESKSPNVRKSRSSNSEVETPVVEVIPDDNSENHDLRKESKKELLKECQEETNEDVKRDYTKETKRIEELEPTLIEEEMIKEDPIIEDKPKRKLFKRKTNDNSIKEKVTEKSDKKDDAWSSNYDGYYDYIDPQEEEEIIAEQKDLILKAIGLIVLLLVVYAICIFIL